MAAHIEATRAEVEAALDPSIARRAGVGAEPRHGERVSDVAIVTGGPAASAGHQRRLAQAGYTVVRGDLADALAKDDPAATRARVAAELDVRDQAASRRRSRRRSAWAGCAAS
jgi:hypothetical protein